MNNLLSHEEEIKKIIKYTSELSSDKIKSDEFLVRSGIHTVSGRLTINYKNLIRETDNVCKQK